MIKLQELLPTIFNPTSDCECGGTHKRCDCEIIKESYVWERKFGEPLPKISFKEEPMSDITVDESKEQLNEWGDLYSHVKLVQQHINTFNKDIDAKRGGSFDADSVEYEADRWRNNSKMLKGRDKKLGMWEKKVKKTLDSLIKDYVKAWK